MKAFIIALAFAVFIIAHGEEPQISQSQSGGLTFYHIAFSLTPSNSTLEVPSCFRNSHWRSETISAFRQDGLFEVFIRARDFPVPAPNCNSDWIILRMPATYNDAAEPEKKIKEKKDLWNRLQKMYTEKTGSLEVIIELNPYIHVIDPAVPKLELEYCNVFFRQAHGAYVPYTGTLNDTYRDR